MAAGTKDDNIGTAGVVAGETDVPRTSVGGETGVETTSKSATTMETATMETATMETATAMTSREGLRRDEQATGDRRYEGEFT
jgi:hypothetical protein